MATLHTIGHSTRTLDELIEALRAHDIRTLVDIRSFPMSRRLPHFNREVLEEALAEHKIQYLWMWDLGGRRRKIRDDSPHVALRSRSFRNYADYTLTPEFKQAIAKLLDYAERGRTAYMCAERLYFNCHRMIVSDWLAAHGHQVLHIDATGPEKPHTLMDEARLVGDDVIYKGDRLF